METKLKTISMWNKILKNGKAGSSISLSIKDRDFYMTLSEAEKDLTSGKITFTPLVEVPLNEADLNVLGYDTFPCLSEAIDKYKFWTMEQELKDQQSNNRWRKPAPDDLMFCRVSKLVKDSYVIRLTMGYTPVGGGTEVKRTRYTKILVYKIPSFQYLTEMRNLDKQMKDWPTDHLVASIQLDTLPETNGSTRPGDKLFVDAVARLFQNVYDDKYNMLQTHREHMYDENNGKPDYTKPRASENVPQNEVTYKNVTIGSGSTNQPASNSANNSSWSVVETYNEDVF